MSFRFWRTLQALRLRMVNERATPAYIARGWALGMFVGCAVPFGLQLMVSIPLSFVMRCSKIGATVGTLVTNPFTILFIYPAQTWVGSRLIGSPLTWEYLQDACRRLSHVSVFHAEGWQTLLDIGGRVLGGFFVGGLLLALVLTPITYFAVLRIVVVHQRLVEVRRLRRLQRANERAKESGA